MYVHMYIIKKNRVIIPQEKSQILFIFFHKYFSISMYNRILVYKRILFSVVAKTADTHVVDEKTVVNSLSQLFPKK